MNHACLFAERRHRPDAGGSDLAGRCKMTAALKQMREPSNLPDQMAAFGISGKQGGLARLFMRHPPLEPRFAALEDRR